ncbi:hypothetical protein [Flavobacterium sp.]|uniref:hypothetical protein n=1 Tax=Flavobacterium sp. TaxID=239 RepID=UPI00333FFF98
MDTTTIKEGKSMAILSYVLIIGPLIALSINADKKNPYTSFHLRQGLGLTATFLLIGLTMSSYFNRSQLPPETSFNIAFPFWIFISILTFYGMFSAVMGYTRPIPLLGPFFQKWLKRL